MQHCVADLQVTDTPGLLYRSDEDRNAMELLTVATLAHLPTAALFVMDLTEECGCSCQQQWEIRSELLARFPHKLWIDVVTKVDLLEEEIDAADDLEASQPHLDRVPKDAVQMVRALGPCFTLWKASRCCHSRPQSLIQTLLLQIQWLPHAVRVSSVSQEGIVDLQQAVLDLMQSDGWSAAIDNMRTRDSAELNYGETEVVQHIQLNRSSPV